MLTLPRSGGRSPSLARDAAETLRIGLPLAGSLLAQMAMGITDAVMLGGLGPDALAIGALATSVEVSIVVVLQGVVGAISILVARARGAGRLADIPVVYWTGMALAALLIGPALLLFGLAEPVLRWAGEPAELAAGTGAFLGILRWASPALLAFGVSRAFLPAVDRGAVILPVALAAVLLNALLCYGLIHGAAGLPRLGVAGAALANALTAIAMAGGLLAITHGPARHRAAVRLARPDRAALAALLRLGLPIGATFAVETGLFLAVALLVGTLGAAALAAHQVVLSTISVAFMVPLGLAQAANVRVSHALGAGDGAAARRAGLVAIGLGALCEFGCAAAELLVPAPLVALFLDPSDRGATAIALQLLAVAALFQVADGVQCVAAGALRGRGDTRVPFALAAFGYWGIGFPLAWALARPAGWGAAGAWTGLAAGLVATAALLTTRFATPMRAR